MSIAKQIKKHHKTKTIKQKTIITSPWIAELEHQGIKQFASINQNTETDVCIVGGGIAGVMTAFFTLINTDNNVIIIEANKIAHGATGHNAGQIVGYFEEKFETMREKFGATLTTNAYKDLRKARDLLDEVIKTLNITNDISIFDGYDGYTSLDHIINTLEEKLLKKASGIDTGKLMIEQQFAQQHHHILKKYDNIFSITDASTIKEKLCTISNNFVAIKQSRKGCANSALLCHTMIQKMLAKRPTRLTIYEHSPVITIECFKDYARAAIKKPSATKKSDIIYCTAKRIILCTNGFEYFTIYNRAGEEINSSFHDSVHGIIGSMRGYLEPHKYKTTAISYYTQHDQYDPKKNTEVYYYLTRRNFIHNKKDHTLVCIGGPEETLNKKETYHSQIPLKEQDTHNISKFLHSTYAFTPKNLNYTFSWHGLMGYTKNNIRLIGPEPKNKVLMYNLGCNGVGLLPSIFGGYKISQFLLGRVKQPSVRDPQ